MPDDAAPARAAGRLRHPYASSMGRGYPLAATAAKPPPFDADLAPRKVWRGSA